MRRTLSIVQAVGLGFAAISSPAPTFAAHTANTYCETGISADEELGFSAFPRGDLFCPLIADPKGELSFASYVRGTSSSALGTDIGSVGIGDQLGLFRINTPTLGEGIQLSLAASVFAQFDLNTSSYDLINADYVVGLPFVFRSGPVSGRVRLYHQSSHLGDEFVLRGTVERANFAFESVEVIGSLDLGPIRGYAGGERVFLVEGADFETYVAHGGIELRQGAAESLPTPAGGRARLIAGLDVKVVEELEWAVAWSARAGVEVGRRSGTEHRSRRWSLMAEYYDGPSPYGQFFQEDVAYYGAGIHLGR